MHVYGVMYLKNFFIAISIFGCLFVTSHQNYVVEQKIKSDSHCLRNTPMKKTTSKVECVLRCNLIKKRKSIMEYGVCYCVDEACQVEINDAEAEHSILISGKSLLVNMFVFCFTIKINLAKKLFFQAFISSVSRVGRVSTEEK